MATSSNRETPAEARVRLGIESVTVAGKTVKFVDPLKQMDAEDRLAEREARRTVRTLEQIDDRWTF